MEPLPPGGRKGNSTGDLDSMPTGDYDDEDSDRDDPDWEDSDRDEYGEDSDSVELVPCPECGELIYEEVEQCPVCGMYVTFSTHPFHGRPTWWLILGFVGIVMTILALALSF